MNPELELVLNEIITPEGVAAYNAAFNDNLSLETARRFAAFIWEGATTMFASVSEHNRLVQSNLSNLISLKEFIDSRFPQSPYADWLDGVLASIPSQPSQE